MTKRKVAYSSLAASNLSEMQVRKTFVGVFAALWVCHGLHFQGTQTPDVWDLFQWVCLQAKWVPSPIMCQFSKERFSGKFLYRTSRAKYALHLLEGK